MRDILGYKVLMGALLLVWNVDVSEAGGQATGSIDAAETLSTCFDSDADSEGGGIHSQGHVDVGSARRSDHCRLGEVVEWTCVEDPPDSGHLKPKARLVACPHGASCIDGACPGGSAHCNSDVGRDAFRPPDRTRATAFEALTANRWVTGDGLEKIELRANGTFSWSQYPGGICGTPNFIRHGQWNFKIDADGIGAVYLRTYGSPARRDATEHPQLVLAIQLPLSAARAADLLFLQTRRFVAAEPLERWGGRCTEAHLPEIRPMPFHDRLVETTWVKTNDFDLYSKPDEIRFFDNGRFTASYRGGVCTHGGFWSLEKRGPTRRSQGKVQLAPISDDNDCDLRGGRRASIAASNSSPILDGNLLKFRKNSYYALDRPIEAKYFSWRLDWLGLELDGTYVGEFEEGAATTLSLNIRNTDDRSTPKRLVALRVGLQRYVPNVPDANGFQPDGVFCELFVANFDEKPLEVGEPYSATFDVTPSESGEHMRLSFEITYLDSVTTRHAREGYILRIPALEHASAE